MRYQICFIIAFVSLQFLSSCQEDIKELKEETPVDKSASFQTKSWGYDIDGGYLPEVEITANAKIPGFDEEGGPGGDGDLYGKWWNPPSDNDPYEGGGGIGGNKPKKVTLSVNLIKLFPKGADMSDSALVQLNAVYKKMVQHCEWNSLSDMLLKSDRQGGKVRMSSALLPGSASTDMENGNLTFYDFDLINDENFCHEFIHLCQSYLYPYKDFVGTFEDYEGMVEFQLVLIQDMMQYVKEGIITHSANEAEYPIHSSWLNYLELNDSEKKQYKNIGSVYLIWIMSLCPDRKLPKEVKLDTHYYRFCDFFFKYSRGYRGRGFKVSTIFENTALNAMLNVVSKCLNK